MSTPQIVLDTNVVIAAQRSQRGASARLLSLLGTGAFDLHLSVPLVLEYESVLMRQRAELGLTYTDVADLLDALCALGVAHRIYYRWRPFLRDAGDEHVLELAVAARCGFIVTHNRRDFAGAERFGVNVVGPGAFLHHIGATP
jgi:putative PIN family toxin of toxin-antitoxin system